MKKPLALFISITLVHLTAGAMGMKMAASQSSDAPSDMVLIPAGEFWMGRAEFQYLFERNNVIERDRLDDGPAHLVYLDAFYIDKYEVTHEAYARFAEATHIKLPWYWPHGKIPKDHEQLPVYEVDWSEASAYCAWAGKRLPTEAEWERAARGGLDRKKFVWGDEEQLNSAHLNYPWGPLKVGSFPPNGYGLYDVIGNVWEWTSDWYNRDYYTVTADRNPKGPDTGIYRVIRGAGWTDGYDGRNLMVSHRSYADPTTRAFTIGIRCAK